MKEIFAPDTFLFRVLPKAKPQTGVVYIPSQFNIPFDCDGKRYVFNTLTKQCLEGELPRQARAGEGFDSLIGTYVLVPRGKDECAFYESVSAMLRLAARKKDIHGYVILPTLHCNARCVYCYEEGWPVKVMTPETADAVADFICRTKREGIIKLHWFGGEPLCAPKTISRICRILQDRGVKYDSAIVTNATLLTPELVKEAVDLWHLSGAQVSMDGARQDYEARKRYLNPEQHNYEKAMEGVTLLLDAGIRVSIRCNFDGENLPRLQDFMEDCRDRFGERKNICVYVEQLRPVPDGEESWTLYQAGDDAELYEESLGLVAPDRAGDRRLTMSYCIADPYGSALVIDPLGGLHACEHKADDTPIGTVFDAEPPSRAAE